MVNKKGQRVVELRGKVKKYLPFFMEHGRYERDSNANRLFRKESGACRDLSNKDRMQIVSILKGHTVSA